MIPLPMPISKIKAYVANQANKPSADRPHAELEPSINALKFWREHKEFIKLAVTSFPAKSTKE